MGDGAAPVIVSIAMLFCRPLAAASCLAKSWSKLQRSKAFGSPTMANGYGEAFGLRQLVAAF
jgi:hypothetical protein